MNSLGTKATDGGKKQSADVAAQTQIETQKEQIVVLAKATGRPTNTNDPQLNKKNEDYVRAIVQLPLDDAKKTVARETRKLNLESEYADSLAERAANLTGMILTTTDKAIREEAGKLLVLTREFLTQTKGVETPALEPLISAFLPIADAFIEKPGVAVAEDAKMAGRAANENASFYKRLALIGVPQEKIEAFTESRADAELAIIERGNASGKKPDEIDREISASRRLAVRDFYAELTVAGVAVNQQMVDEGNQYVKMGDIGDDFLDKGKYSQAINARNWQEFSEVAHSAGLGFAITTGLLTLGEIASVEVKSPGAEAGAAAQAAQMDAIFKQKDADQMKKEMDEMLEELKALKEKDTVEEADLSPETKEMLEKMEIEKEDTIKEAIERVETIIANIEMQQEKIDGLKGGFDAGEWEGGMMPPLHENPEEVLEKNGIVEDGKLTELGKEVMPELLKESAADFMQACDTILFRIEIVGNEELMDKLNDAKRDVENYMANPESVEKLAAFNEAMQDPEIVAVHAAFFEAIAENAGEVVAGRHEEE